MFSNLIQTNLTTRILGKKIEQFTWTESTNNDAWTLIDEGTHEGTVVITDKQTAGKGRGGRSWVSVPGKSLTATIVLKPVMESRFSGWLPLMTGVAIVDTFAELGLAAELKWPNDIMVVDKKLGGILCESRVHGQTLAWAVIGIGLNINEQGNELPEDLNATSFFAERGSSIQRELVLAMILNILEQLYISLKETKDTSTLADQWTDHCNHVHKTVKFKSGNESLSGEFIGINENGAAIIQTNGNEHTYTSGDIHLIRS